jgi:phosphoglycerate dehydrogenase-like enzyme
MENPPIEMLITIPLDNGMLEKFQHISPHLNVTQIVTRKVEDIPADIWLRTEILYTDVVLPTAAMVPNLSWIQFHWAGVEFLLDTPLAQKPALILTTLSGAAAPQMAEYILMMMMALGHHIPDLYANQLKTDWPRDRWERFEPFELRGSTVGIIGYGSIGREVARLLQPFNTKILAIKRDMMDPRDSGYFAEGLGDPEGNLFTRLYPIQAIRSVLKECDFVVVTLPLSPQTRSIIGVEELAVMKSTAFLIDACRGHVVNQNALLNALQEKKIGGAALDVFAEEPLPPNSAFWRLSNVIITPHISAASPFYNQRAFDLVAENINRYLIGVNLLNPYKAELGY